MLALLLVAASVGLSNFAASIAIGTGGVDARTRLRVGLIFGLFESGMPVLGLIIGARVADSLGSAARWVGAGLLVAVGIYALASAARAGQGSAGQGSTGQRSAGLIAPVRAPGITQLLVSGLALSADNLVAGVAIGVHHTSIAVGAIVFGAVSAAMSLAGLELGAGLGRRAGQRGEQLAGMMLICVGIAIAFGALS